MKITRAQLHQIIKENLEQEKLILEGKDHPRVPEIVDKLSKGASLAGDTKALDVIDKIIKGGGLPIGKIKFLAILVKDIGKMVKLLLNKKVTSFKDFAAILKESFGMDVDELLTGLLLASAPVGTGLLVDFIVKKLKDVKLDNLANNIYMRLEQHKSKIFRLAGDPASQLQPGESYAQE